MKTICTAKLTSRAKASGFQQSPEHDQCAAAFLAQIHQTRDTADMAAFHAWATLTRHAPLLGGVNEGNFRAWLDRVLDQLNQIVVAADHLRDNGKRLAKELPRRRKQAEANVESIEKMLAELQASLSEQRGVLAEVAAEQARLDSARLLVERAEDNAQKGDMLGMAYGFIASGMHPYEAD